jgi:hypothetical protein
MGTSGKKPQKEFIEAIASWLNEDYHLPEKK